jgi:hypothetical protein
MDDCLRVEFEAELVVESSASSITLHVCKVASGANDTRLFARDFRLAARRSRIACFSAWRFSSSSCARSRVSAFAATDSLGVRLAIGLNGSATFSAPVIDISPPSCLFGPGVEKSMRSSSAPCLAGDLPFPFPVLRFRNSSNVGIDLGGVRGTVGFKIDLIWKDSAVCLLSTLRPAKVRSASYLCCVAI